ncbi:HNH endonuclease signature motif containing protein [Cryobacterium sp. TMT2-23]|uniref:HNH endonuclease signature motif containing protein n=1 Tax=Cryobacterium sp. TMT2-23 TaxID=1259252 RepID=UPI00106A3360|nr:HNH endonuclease signature motif containing protein [Cryobacterium sp. TMT2-23]TFD18968.1 HNH endonuclease [Cryobacterium sp. TMT2-23]
MENLRNESTTTLDALAAFDTLTGPAFRNSAGGPGFEFDAEAFFDVEEFDDAGLYATGLQAAGPAAGELRFLDRRVGMLAELVGAAAAADRLLASVSAARAEAVERVRSWCFETEANAERERTRRALVARAVEHGVTADDADDADDEVGRPHSAVSAGVLGLRWDALEIAHRTAIAELACALHVSQAAASNLLAKSEALSGAFMATRDALSAGRISYAHARVLIEQANSLPEEAGASFEAEVLPVAERVTVAQFDRVARRVRERTHPESITVRRRKCEADRVLVLEPAQDGMGWLHSYQPMPVAQAIFTRVSDMAASLQGLDEERTLAQLRADVFADLMVDGVTPAGLGRGVRATVNVTVPVLTLLGKSEEPGLLEGYGPIDPETARLLAAGAPSFTRILVHPETGVMLSVGRDQYRVPKDLRRLIEIRDGTCRFPGCTRPAVRAQVDHGHEWQHTGETRYDNLACLCAPDHRLKTQTNWTVTQQAGGVLDWTAPSGLNYRSDPAVPFEPVEPAADVDPPPF